VFCVEGLKVEINKIKLSTVCCEKRRRVYLHVEQCSVWWHNSAGYERKPSGPND